MLSRTSSLTDLIRQSGELRAPSRHPPVIGAVLDIHWIILSVLLTFRAFTAALSRIAAFNTPGAPLRAPQFFRSGTGHRVKVRPLATPFAPQISFVRGKSFRRLIRSLSLRPSCLLAPRADQTGATFRPHRPPRAFTSGLSGHRVSGRALARAPLGGGFPSLPFRLQSGFSVPPSATFPAAPPKIRTSGFPTVRLPASGTLQFGTELSAGPPRLRLTPAMPPIGSRVVSVLRRPRPPLRYPPLSADSRLRRRHLSPEVLAPSGFCCPARHRLPTSSASQEDSRPFPGIRRL